MISTCKECGESVGYGEAVGCVSVMIPTICVSLIYAVIAPIAVSILIHRGLLGKHSPCVHLSSWLLPVMYVVLPMIFWQLPIWLEGIRNRFRRCPKCRSRKWEICGRSFGP